MAANIRPLLTFKHIQSLFTATATSHNYNSNTFVLTDLLFVLFHISSADQNVLPNPPPRGQPRDLRETVCDKKGRGTGK